MYSIARKLLFGRDAEDTHEWFKKNAHWLLPLVHQKNVPFVSTNIQVFKILCNQKDRNLEFTFKNPIGLAAGFDKNGELIDLIHHLGFGYIEVGSVTAVPWAGNKRPRIFRLEKDFSIINRMGLPGKGANEVLINLQNKLPTTRVPVGVNIASTPGADDPIQDILYTFKLLRHLPIAYFTVNISCPNTADSHNAKMDFVKDLVREILIADKQHKIPILLKLAPDDVAFAVSVVQATREVHGYVCGNTSPLLAQGHAMMRSDLPDGLTDVEDNTKIGGMSGEILRDRSLILTKEVCQAKLQDQLVIGCGGITDGYDALKRLGWSDLCQIYTGLIYQGPSVVKDICEFLRTHDSQNPRQKVSGGHIHQ